jgi:hypothetical protein
MSHTPGPWGIRKSKNGSGDVGISAPNVKNVIAECFAAMRHHDEKATDEATANAQLMAASPDLLEVAKQAEKELLWAADQFEGGEVLRLAAQNVRAAIAKAKGESQ